MEIATMLSSESKFVPKKQRSIPKLNQQDLLVIFTAKVSD